LLAGGDSYALVSAQAAFLLYPKKAGLINPVIFTTSPIKRPAVLVDRRTREVPVQHH